jgi:hypothetical protein
MNNESQWTLNEAVGPRFRYCRVLPLEGRQETKKAREDKQTRVSNTQLTDVAVLANCPICSLYCYQLLDSVAVSAKMDTLLSTFYIWYQITFEVQAKSFHIYTFIMCLQFYVNICPTRCNYTQFILSVNCSTCFGRFLPPSSGAQITVSTASGTSQPLLLPVEQLELINRCCYLSSNWN